MKNKVLFALLGLNISTYSAMAAAASSSVLEADSDRPARSTAITFPPSDYEMSAEESAALSAYQTPGRFTDQESVNQALFTATISNQKTLVRYLTHEGSDISPRPDEEAMNTSLSLASYGGYFHTVEYYLSPSSGLKTRPSELGVNASLLNAVNTPRAENSNRIKIIQLLLESEVSPTQEYVDKAFLSAMENDRDSVCQFLLDVKSSILMRPSRNAVSHGLGIAIRKGKLPLVQYLLDGNSEVAIRPDQEGVENAVFLASIMGNTEIYGYLTNPESNLAVIPSGILLPDLRFG